MVLSTERTKISGQSGVYLIQCKTHKYVGSSVDLYARYKQHRNSLKAGTHYNQFLQRLYNKYPDKIVFSIVKLCKDYIKQEAYYITEYECDVNVEKDPVNRSKSDVTKEKLRKANLGKCKGEDNSVSVKVYQYTLNGEFIAGYVSLRSAATHVDGNENSIGEASRSTGRNKSASGFLWSQQKLKKLSPLKPILRRPYKYSSILIIDGNKEIEALSIKEAAEILGANEPAVRKAIKHGFKCKRKIIKLKL